MLKFLKKIFSNPEPERKEVKMTELAGWLNDFAAKQDYNSYFQNYFKQISEIKTGLNDKVKILKTQQISEKDKKQVEARVQNIVTGHKESYAREIERFSENLFLPEKESFSTIEDYQTAQEYNKNIDKEIEELAKRTAKSYQATQHLFFDQVEPVFKQMGELNLLVKNFDKNNLIQKIASLTEIRNIIEKLNEEDQRKSYLIEEIKNKENNIKQTNKVLEELKQKLFQLKESKEHTFFQKQTEQKEELNNKRNALENDIFSFFSKLQKPLKKYERIALDDKLIKSYLTDSIAAFYNDKELEILEILQGLKKAIDKLEFGEKQKGKFIELIEISEKGYLQGISGKVKEIKEQEEKFDEEIKKTTIIGRIENIEREIGIFSNKIDLKEKELNELRSKLEKTDIEKIKEEFCGKVKDVFNVEMTLLT